MDENLYTEDIYLSKHPSIDVEDSPWKFSKIVPLISAVVQNIDKKEINLLDVGGGAGVILKSTASYITNNFNLKVNKFALDLSPGMLEIQKENNRDLKECLNEDIRKTSLEDKEIDITLMIDVLEHIPYPEKALEELKRISNFVIFKIPLENNLYSKTLKILKIFDTEKIVGHVNFYTLKSAKTQINKYNGKVVDLYFTNVFNYYRNSDYYQKRQRTPSKLIHFFGDYIYKISPRLCSHILNDHIMILVKCYD